jgi:transcriptional regulator with XRE-family HTH domain
MSYHRRYKLKDDRFGLMALTLREKAGLAQTEVASVLGVSERTIRHWEGGTAFPTADNLKKLIELYLHHGAFVSGHGRGDRSRRAPGARADHPEPGFPSPEEFDAGPLTELIGPLPPTPLREGVAATVALLRERVASGAMTADALLH